MAPAQMRLGLGGGLGQGGKAREKGRALDGMDEAECRLDIIPRGGACQLLNQPAIGVEKERPQRLRYAARDQGWPFLLVPCAHVPIPREYVRMIARTDIGKENNTTFERNLSGCLPKKEEGGGGVRNPQVQATPE